jgi:hypothetical protein
MMLFWQIDQLCQNIQNINCGLSDVHNIISVQIKGTIPRINKKFVEYRSFKNFDQEYFLNDLEQENLKGERNHLDI